MTPHDDDDFEIDAEFLKAARPIQEVPELAFLLKRGRPPVAPEHKKVRVTLYLDPDVLKALKQEGEKGWQTRANAALRKTLNLNR